MIENDREIKFQFIKFCTKAMYLNASKIYKII